MGTRILRRVAGPGTVALETTLLVHGVPRDAARPLLEELEARIRAEGAEPALVGVVGGTPIVGMSRDELDALLAADRVAKANTGNLGLLVHRGAHAATTVSATVELAAAAGVALFATGGLGGVHRDYGTRLDVSADLLALARWPVAVVASGVKTLLDVESTREALESLGVPVVGVGTDRFPAFYLRASAAGAAARIDDLDELRGLVRAELARSGRGLLLANPIPTEAELDAAALRSWIDACEAEARAAGILGRDVTPFVLARLHERSGGATLEANLALVRANASLAARLAAAFA